VPGAFTEVGCCRGREDQAYFEFLFPREASQTTREVAPDFLARRGDKAPAFELKGLDPVENEIAPRFFAGIVSEQHPSMVQVGQMERLDDAGFRLRAAGFAVGEADFMAMEDAVEKLRKPAGAGVDGKGCIQSKETLSHPVSWYRNGVTGESGDFAQRLRECLSEWRPAPGGKGVSGQDDRHEFVRIQPQSGQEIEGGGIAVGFRRRIPDDRSLVEVAKAFDVPFYGARGHLQLVRENGHRKPAAGCQGPPARPLSRRVEGRRTFFS